MSRIGNLLAVIALALVLQGCLAEYKEIIDSYDAVFRIPAGKERPVFSYVYAGPGSYCFQSGLLSFEGRIHQRLAERSDLQLIGRHFDALDALQSTWRQRVIVRQDGAMPLREWNWDGLCIGKGERITVSAKPSFEINQNVRVWTRFVFDATYGATPW